MITTMSYIFGTDDVVKAGCLYYFGELYEGEDIEEILSSGCVAMWDVEIEEERIVDFDIVDHAEDVDNTLNYLVKVTGIR